MPQLRWSGFKFTNVQIEHFHEVEGGPPLAAPIIEGIDCVKLRLLATNHEKDD